MRVDLTRHWYQPSLTPLTTILLPFSWIFSLIVYVRRFLYRHHILKSYRLTQPIIVVGNITVGGTGKTPFVIWLANFLKARGYRPGLISRGVGGVNHRIPYLASQNDSVCHVGDEAILLMKETGCPLVLCNNKVAAAGKLIAMETCDIIISDDGLQHYRLNPQMKIALIDGKRKFGNQKLLPAGPLRESLSALNTCDFTIVNSGEDTDPEMCYEPIEFISVKNPTIKKSLNDFQEQSVHATAAIGHPEQFFQLLRSLGLKMASACAFKDHYLFSAADFKYQDQHPIVMTEKDAVKCSQFADERYWYLKIDVKLSEIFVDDFLQKLTLLMNH